MIPCCYNSCNYSRDTMNYREEERERERERERGGKRRIEIDTIR